MLPIVEGTDYGRHETSLDDKVLQVLGQLKRREAFVVFEPSTASGSIVVAGASPAVAGQEPATKRDREG